MARCFTKIQKISQKKQIAVNFVYSKKKLMANG